jgi:hypothetical protein
MKPPVQTPEIFKILSKGQFICSNSSDKNISTLYNLIDDDSHYEVLRDYFEHINFTLERGDEYFYFSRPESKVGLEKKIEKALEWIDIIDFLKTFDNAFSAGNRFSPSDILVRLKTDAELETKLEALKKNTDKVKHQDILDKILKRLIDDTFIELENDITHQYKVLASFKYLEQLILSINIPDEIKDEIPE